MFLAVELPLGIITILHTVSSTVYDFLDYKIVKSTILVACKHFPQNNSKIETLFIIPDREPVHLPVLPAELRHLLRDVPAVPRDLQGALHAEGDDVIVRRRRGGEEREQRGRGPEQQRQGQRRGRRRGRRGRRAAAGQREARAQGQRCK